LKRLLLALSLVCPAFAGEYAVLHTGFRLYADRHEALGDLVRLHTGSSFIEVPAKDVARFEMEEYVPPPPPAPAPPVTAPAEPAPQRATPHELLADAATVHGLRPEFVRSVAAVESAYRPDAVSPKGAIGLMQLMPGTAKELGVNPHNPAENADGGVRYLKELLLRYAGTKDPVRLALAAYNAGPGAVDRYRSIPPYRETQAYVEKVLRKYLAELKASGQLRSGT
jgi:soluble lytic murein transglycosylase-like protein